jgi:hypothetical protein
MFRYRASLTVPYKINGLTMCLYHNESSVNALPCQENICIFRRPADIIMSDHCLIQRRCEIISPNNHAQRLCILIHLNLSPFIKLKSEVRNICAHCTQKPWHTAFPHSCFKNMMHTSLENRISLTNHLKDVFKKCVNFKNNIVEVSSLVYEVPGYMCCSRGSAITGLPGYWLHVLFTVHQPQIYLESL